MFDRLFRRSPSEFTLSINGQALAHKAQAKESLLLAALREGLAFPHNCRVGGCGECKCRLVSGEVKELSDKSYLLSAEEIKQNYILACQSQPRSDVAVEVHLKTTQASHTFVETSGHITALHPLTHDILSVQVRLEQAMPYVAGQAAEIEVPLQTGGSSGEWRSYSFAAAHAPAQPDLVSFFIRKVPGGAFTTWLFEQGRVGSALKLRGPSGDFHLRPGNGPIVCMAGGSGLAPIKAMLEQAVQDKQAHRPLVLIFGARTQADLYGADTIEQIRQQWGGRFEFITSLSDEPVESTWVGLRGMVTEHVLNALGNQLPEHQAYLCGPPTMVDACTAVLTQHGMPAAQVFADRFLDRSHSR